MTTPSLKKNTEEALALRKQELAIMNSQKHLVAEALRVARTEYERKEQDLRDLSINTSQDVRTRVRLREGAEATLQEAADSVTDRGIELSKIVKEVKEAEAALTKIKKSPFFTDPQSTEFEFNRASIAKLFDLNNHLISSYILRTKRVREAGPET